MRTSISGVTASGLGKRFGDLWALRDVDLDVPAGTVLGLLGHNGAGKTTAIRILTTLALPTTGTAHGRRASTSSPTPAKVRTRIGLAGQAATVDDLLTARANLEMIGRLYHLPRREARRRGDELLERLGLTDAADRLVRTYSGGMRRRLDLAAGLVAAPPVLFLDEPTTGLDPQGRNELWAVLRELVSDGTTLVLTTQYLEEADRLADYDRRARPGPGRRRGHPGRAEAAGRRRARRGDRRPAADVARAAAALAPFGDGAAGGRRGAGSSSPCRSAPTPG